MYQKVRRNDLISQVMKRCSREKRDLGEEIVLIDMNYPNSLQQRILELNQNFRLLDFLMGWGEVETAIGIITPKQSLFLECELVDNDHHAYNFQVLYDAIYDSNEIVLPLKSSSTWQELVMRDGNIAIQLTKFGDFYLWCPDKINSYQYDSLREIYDTFQSIQTIDSDFFQSLFFDVRAWVERDDGKDISILLENASLDKLLDYYEDNKDDYLVLLKKDY